MPRLFHTLDQRCFREARRRLGEMLGDGERLPLQRVVRAHRRQAAGVFVLLVVATFLVERQKTVELDDLSGGTQLQRAGACLRRDVHGGALQLGRFHLARDSALPDQLIEPRLVGIELAAHAVGAAGEVGRADRFVRFLGVLGLGLVLARRIRHVGVAVILADHLARLGDRLGGDLHAVGPHVSNETGGFAANVDAFIEALGDAHRVRRRKAVFAAGFLLQGRGGEGRLRIAPRGFRVDRGHGVGGEARAPS